MTNLKRHFMKREILKIIFTGKYIVSCSSLVKHDLFLKNYILEFSNNFFKGSKKFSAKVL